MPKKITELTDEQRAAMPAHAEKWIKIGLSCEPADWDTFDKYMPVAYKKAGFEYPKTVIRVPSPVVGARLASILNKDGVEDGVEYTPEKIKSVLDKYKGQRLEWHSWIGGQFWVGGHYGSPSFVAFLTDVCDLELEPDIAERAEACRKISESVGYIWCNTDFVVVCDRPLRIVRNDNKQLHNDSGAAMEYRDGWGMYCLHGERFPKALWEKIVNKTLTMEELNNISSADQRAIALMYLPPDDLLKEIKAELIHTGVKGTRLYRVPNLFNSGETHYCIRMTDSSPTGREFIEWTTPDVGRKGDADYAQAAAWGISKEEYLGCQKHA